ILHKSTDYWAAESLPLSAETVGAVLSVTALQKMALSGWLVVVLAAIGVALRRNDFLGRSSIGLALCFPILMIAISASKSLLLPRYFLPSVSCLFLLAAGVAGARWTFRSLAAATMITALSTSVLIRKPYYVRVYVDQAEQQLELLR